MKVYFYTLGCRVNQYETDAARELFLKEGFEPSDNPSDADVIIVNTCTVTGEADRKSRQQLRKMGRINPGAVIVAMGCASEMTDGVVEADIVLGTRDKDRVVTKVKEYLTNKAKDESAETRRGVPHRRPEVTKSDEYHDFGTVISPEGTRAFMKIEDGCNKFCSYCIIPFARGRVASRDKESIRLESMHLASMGFKEIVVSGIHVCSYGKDRGEDISSLYEVLRMIADTEGIERLRLGSLEPMSLTADFISQLATIKELCPHFHLSLQSGSDSVLKRMNRDYDSAQYLSKVALLRKAFPTMSLTTDIIVGFPGETDDEFEETVRFIDRAGFSKIHVFPYSVREGTVAARMKPQVQPDVKKSRASRLIAISDEKERLFARSFAGTRKAVLLEKESEEPDGSVCFSGYSPEYVRCLVKAPKGRYQKGDIITVEMGDPFCRPV